MTLQTNGETFRLGRLQHMNTHCIVHNLVFRRGNR